jgi:phage recombination protein Bet
MSVKDSLSQKYSYRDVIMPGIGLYRIQAHRSNQYGGITAPEYGPILTLTNGSEEFAFPEWCKITVKRIVDSVSTDFTAKEYWIENYATAGKDTIAPNAMWKKRPYGQLAKCAEAQALRKAFPEIVSQAPTFEELKPDFDVNCKLAEIKEKPILNQESPRWARAVQQLAENKITIEEIKNYVVLGEEDEEEMIFQSDELAAKLNEEQQEEKE